MPDLDDLQRAVREVADRATPPPFDTLVGRARARRRQRRLATAAAAVVVLAGAVAVLLPRDRGPALPAAAERVVAQGRLASFGGNDRTGLGIWEQCRPATGNGQDRCRSAWQLVDSHGVRAAGLTGSSEPGQRVVPGPGGYLITPGDRLGLVVRDDGSSVPVVRRAGTRQPGPGDVVVPHGSGLLVVDLRSGTAAALRAPHQAYSAGDAQVGPDGTVWCLLPTPSDPGLFVVARIRDGAGYNHPVPGPRNAPEVRAGLATSAGDTVDSSHVAALTSYDVNGRSVTGMLAVSTNGGASWSDLGPPQLPFHGMASAAATSTGTLFVAEPDGTLWRSSDASWARFERVPGLRVRALRPAGRDVVALPRSGAAESVLRIAGDGSAQTVSLR